MLAAASVAIALGVLSSVVQGTSLSSAGAKDLSGRQSTNVGYRAITFTAANTGGSFSGAPGTTQPLPGCAIVSQSLVQSVYGIDPNTCHVLLYNTPTVYTVTIESFSNELIDDTTCNSFTYNIQANGAGSGGYPLDYGQASLYGLTTCSGTAVVSTTSGSTMSSQGAASSTTSSIISQTSPAASSSVSQSTATSTQNTATTTNLASSTSSTTSTTSNSSSGGSVKFDVSLTLVLIYVFCVTAIL